MSQVVVPIDVHTYDRQTSLKDALVIFFGFVWTLTFCCFKMASC